MGRKLLPAIASTIALLATLLVSPTATPSVVAAEQSVLFVVGNGANPSINDRRVADLIESGGVDVAMVDDDAVSVADAIGFDGVLVSSSIVPSKVGSMFRSIATPIVVWEPYLFSELKMTRSGGSNRGELSGLRAVDIRRPDHPLAAGLSGTVSVTGSNGGLSWGRVVQQGVAIASVPGALAKATIFVYEPGSQMDAFVAPAVRVGLFPSFATGNDLTTDGQALIVAAVDYALGRDDPGAGNATPLVDAGDDQRLAVDPPVGDVQTTIVATASDDGLPAVPGALTLRWTGPSGVTFGAPTSMSSTVTVPGVGSYQLTITASDGELSASDSMTLTVEEVDPDPDNEPPRVDAGADIEVVDGASITVVGTVSDDGLPAAPGAVALSWTGPAGVAFDTPNAATSGVTVPGPGSYELTLTADDGDLSTSDAVMVTVSEVAPPSTGEFDIMYIALNDTGASAEQAAIQRLGDAGHTVTVVNDNVADPADAVNYDLVVVSSSISPFTFDSAWKSTPTPMVVWEAKVFDELDLVAKGTADGFMGTQRYISILDSTHPITAGFSGLVRVTSSGRSIAWGRPEGDARLLASTKSSASKVSIFTYEPGDATDDGTAPARRVGLFLNTNSPQVMTDDGWTLFDRAIAWAGQTPTPAPVADAAADIAAGQAPQTVSFDASASTGTIVSYRWDFADGTTGTGVTAGHTYSGGGSFDVVLTVTDGQGRTATDTVTLVFDPPAPGGGNPDPIVSYDFVQGARPDYVDDVSGVGTPLDLKIHDTNDVAWLPGGGLSIETGTKLESDTTADKILGAVVATQEITIEAWVDPINATQTGPARIVALSNGYTAEDNSNAMLAQGYQGREGDRVEARFKTTDTTDHGQPGVLSRDAALDGDLVHLVFTRTFLGVERIYVNGTMSKEWHVSGDTSSWDMTTPLVLANETGEEVPWRGVFHRVQIYDRALDAGEVCANVAAGPGRPIEGNDAPYPCVTPTGATGSDAPHTVQFDSAGSVDLDGTIVSRSWNFGDGVTSSAVAPGHRYTQPGDYEVTLTVTDNDGASATATYIVEIGDPLPVPPPTLTEASGMRVGNGFFNLDEHLAREAWLGRELNWTAQITAHHSASEMGSSSNGLFAHSSAGLPQVVDRMNAAVAVGVAFGYQDLKTGTAAQVREGLARTINGEYDFLYYRAATRMLDAGYGDAVIRLGHEFNAKWPPWASKGNESFYIAAYQHVAALFRNVSPDFQFEWSGFKNTWAASAPQAYPGDEWVDIISFSLYWKNINSSKLWSESKWTTEYAQNLGDLRDFAIAHGKPMGLSEWGIQGLDEPRFIERVHDFLAALPADGPGRLAYNVYWDSGADDSRLDNLPAVKARYKQLFG